MYPTCDGISPHDDKNGMSVMKKKTKSDRILCNGNEKSVP